MTHDRLPIAADPRRLAIKPLGRRRRMLLMAGMTGLMVSAPAQSFADVVTTGAATHIAGDQQPDPDVHPAMAGPLGPAGRVADQLRELAGVSADRADETGPVSQVAAGPTSIARWDGVNLRADGSRIELVGFHESNNPDALVFAAGQPIAENLNPAVEVATTGEADGQVVVLPSRSRPSAPMTAIDLAVHPDATVVSPVNGVVVDVAPFQLYGGTDHKVRIRPDGNAAAEVSLIHLEDPLVQAGQRVEAGVTPIAASPRQLDFDSQVDRFTEAQRGVRTPHVHIEMRHAPAGV